MPLLDFDWPFYRLNFLDASSFIHDANLGVPHRKRVLGDRAVRRHPGYVLVSRGKKDLDYLLGQ